MPKRSDYLSWDEYFMGVAMLSSYRSKDPNTQVGACIVNDHNKIMSVGYNGFPTGCSDDEFPWAREGDAYDMTLVHLECRDERGNRIPTAFDPVLLTTEGPIQVVGPRAVSLEGGAFGTFVRTVGETGEGVLTLSSPTLGSCQLRFTIIPEVK